MEGVSIARMRKNYTSTYTVWTLVKNKQAVFYV